MELGNLVFGNSRGRYPVNRDWQKMFCEYLYEMGFDDYGHIDDEDLQQFEVKIKSKVDESTYKFENDIFSIMPYYWGDDDSIRKLPNFIYKPTGFELSWYKYALRDSYMNQNISYQELKDIMDKCKNSIQSN